MYGIALHPKGVFLKKGMTLMRYLVIAEKPELGKAIGKAIPPASDGRLVPAGTYKVLAARGHLLELKAPQDYDPQLGTKWTLEQLPIFFRNWEQKPREIRNPNTGKTQPDPDALHRLENIEKALKECDCVIHAGDPDDEGQFLIDEILQRFHNTKPVLRLLINDLSPDYIRKQMNHLEPNEKYMPLGVGAYARSVADFMFGINFTRYYSLLYNAARPLSVGRVQTPTLGLVVNRDKEIENHVMRMYYTLGYEGATGDASFPVSFVPNKDSDFLEEGKVFDRTVMEGFLRNIPEKLSGAAVVKKMMSTDPPLPFNLVKLQTYCGSRFKLTPQEALDTTQVLREKYNLITYNRSDCQYLNNEQHEEAPAVLAAVYKNLGINTAPALIDTTIVSRCFDSGSTTAHHAIIPTQATCDMSQLTDRERNVYGAIALFYMLQFMPPKIQRKTSMSVELADGHRLQSSSMELLEAGWCGYAGQTGMDDVDEDKASEGSSRTPLSDLKEGTYILQLRDGHIDERETKPPKRYTEYSLNEDMTRIARYVSDPEVKRILLEKDKGKKGENGSIGTSATRASIIGTLFRRGFIETAQDKKNKYIVSTKLGRSFYAMLPEDIKGANVTARWWAILEDIKEQSVDKDALFDSVLEHIRETIADRPSTLPEMPGLRHRGDPIDYSDRSLGKCPRCGRDVIEGKKGFGCVGWSDKEKPCNFTIWKDNKLLAASGKSVTKKMVKDMLGEKKKTHMTGLTSQRTRKTYDADLVLDDTGKYVNLKLVFPERKPMNTRRGPGYFRR